MTDEDVPRVGEGRHVTPGYHGRGFPKSLMALITVPYSSPAMAKRLYLLDKLFNPLQTDVIRPSWPEIQITPLTES